MLKKGVLFNYIKFKNNLGAPFKIQVGNIRHFILSLLQYNINVVITDPSETHLTPFSPSAFEHTSTESLTIKVE